MTGRVFILVTGLLALSACVTQGGRQEPPRASGEALEVRPVLQERLHTPAPGQDKPVLRMFIYTEEEPSDRSSRAGYEVTFPLYDVGLPPSRTGRGA